MSDKRNVRVVILNHYETLSPRVENEVRALNQAGYRLEILCWQREEVAQPLSIPVAMHPVKLRAPKGRSSLLVYLPRLYARLYNDS